MDRQSLLRAARRAAGSVTGGVGCQAPGPSLLQGGSRGLASSSSARAPRGEAPLLEVRKYTLKPEGIKPFLKITTQFADLRKELLPLRGFYTTDTGGVLNQVTHVYSYDDYEHRDARRRATAQSQAWQDDHLAQTRPHVSLQESSIYRTATPLLDALGVEPTAAWAPPEGAAPGSWEFRRIGLDLGADLDALYAVLQKSYEGRDYAPHGTLVFVGSSEQAQNREVLEIWRWESAAAAAAARQAPSGPAHVDLRALRAAGAIDLAVSNLAPTAFSPWR